MWFRVIAFVALCACVTPITSADAFSSFKGRFSSNSNDCVYPGRDNTEKKLEDGERMYADPKNPNMARFNNSCSCPAEDYKTVMSKPAVLACIDGLLMTQTTPECSCKKKESAKAITDVILNNRGYGGGGYGYFGPNGKKCPNGYEYAGSSTDRYSKKKQVGAPGHGNFKRVTKSNQTHLCVKKQ